MPNERDEYSSENKNFSLWYSQVLLIDEWLNDDLPHLAF